MAKRKPNVDEMTVEELRVEAAARGVEGRSAMNKDELVAALKRGDSPPPPVETEGMTVAPYPPSPSDAAGEKTDNVPPAKRLPPPAPDEGVDELTLLRAQNAALARVVANLGGNPAEVAKQAAAGLEPAAKKAAGPTKRATVRAGAHETEVEYPADAENPDQAAVDAYKEKHGLWHLPEQPSVRHDEAPKRAKKSEE
jgi:hypothetical protein